MTGRPPRPGTAPVATGAFGRVGALLGLLAAGCLAGCGVQPSDVIDAGPPAQGVEQPADYRFFVVDGKLRPIPSDPELAAATMADLPFGEPASGDADRGARREPGDLSPALRVTAAVRELLIGPGPAERQLGASTALSGQASAAFVKMSATSVDVILLTDVGRLSPLAMAQVACTVTSVRAGQSAGWRGRITVIDPAGGKREVPPCPEADLTALPMAGQRAVG